MSYSVQIQPVSGSPPAWSHPGILGKRLWVPPAGRCWLFPKAFPPAVLSLCAGVTTSLCLPASLLRDALGASHGGPCCCGNGAFAVRGGQLVLLHLMSPALGTGGSLLGKAVEPGEGGLGCGRGGSVFQPLEQALPRWSASWCQGLAH